MILPFFYFILFCLPLQACQLVKVWHYLFFKFYCQLGYDITFFLFYWQLMKITEILISKVWLCRESKPGLLAIRAWCANHYTTESRLTTSGPPATSWSSLSRSTVSSRTGTGRLPLSSERSTSPTSERKSSPGTLESCRLSGPTPWRRTVRSNWQMSAGTKVSQQVAKKTPFSRFALHCSEVSDTN